MATKTYTGKVPLRRRKGDFYYSNQYAKLNTQTYCREIYYSSLKESFSGGLTVDSVPLEITIYGGDMDDWVNQFIQLIDILVGVTGVSLSPTEVLKLDFEPGRFEYQPVKGYRGSGKRIVYLGIPPQLFLFDPIVTAILQGLTKTAFQLMCYDLQDRIFSLVSTDEVIDIIRNKKRDEAIALTVSIFGELSKIREETNLKDYYDKGNQVLGGMTTGACRSDAMAVIRARKFLKDLPISEIKNRWLNIPRYHENTGFVIFQGWKDKRYPNIWAKS